MDRMSTALLFCSADSDRGGGGLLVLDESVRSGVGGSSASGRTPSVAGNVIMSG